MGNRANKENVSSSFYVGSVANDAIAIAVESLAYLYGHIHESWPIHFRNYLHSHFTSSLHSYIVN